MQNNLDIERHTNKVHTRVMFKQFGQMLYKGFRYHVEEIQKDKLYKGMHTNAARREKWRRVKFEVKVLGET